MNGLPRHAEIWTWWGNGEETRLLVFRERLGLRMEKARPQRMRNACARLPGRGRCYGPEATIIGFSKGCARSSFFLPALIWITNRTTDTAEKINATGGVQAAEVVAFVCDRRGKDASSIFERPVHILRWESSWAQAIPKARLPGLPGERSRTIRTLTSQRTGGGGRGGAESS